MHVIFIRRDKPSRIFYVCDSGDFLVAWSRGSSRFYERRHGDANSVAILEPYYRKRERRETNLNDGQKRREIVDNHENSAANRRDSVPRRRICKNKISDWIVYTIVTSLFTKKKKNIPSYAIKTYKQNDIKWYL